MGFFVLVYLYREENLCLKKIPQDQITRRLFNVYKNVELTQDDVTVFQVHNVTGSFNAETDYSTLV